MWIRIRIKVRNRMRNMMKNWMRNGIRMGKRMRNKLRNRMWRKDGLRCVKMCVPHVAAAWGRRVGAGLGFNIHTYVL